MEDLQGAIVYECACEPRLMLTPKLTHVPKDVALASPHFTQVHRMVLEKQFWCRVWDARKFYMPTSLSILWSIIVAHFIGLHYSNSIDRERFYELTCISSLPSISADVAIFLIEQEQRMFAGVENEEIAHTKDDEKNLTCLQQRCIDALIDSDTGSWKVLKPRTLQGKLRYLPPCVLESLLMCTMVEKKKPPTQNTDNIRVSGAGSEVVNGIYTKSSRSSDRHPMFTRSGFYEGGGGVEFSIYRCTNGCFYISCTGRNGNDDIDFYIGTNRVQGEANFTSDMRWLCDEGEEPLPTFQFV